MRGTSRKRILSARGLIHLTVALVLLTTTTALGTEHATAATSPTEPTFAALGRMVGVGGWEVARGDVDGDGDLDLAAVNQFPPGISLLLGNGDGTFANQVVYPTPEFELTIGFADLNGDGFDDVLAGGQQMGVSVLMANGDGTLAPAVSSTPFWARDLAFGDVNGDQNVDVLVATGGVGSGASVMLGNGDGTLGAPTSVHTVSGGSDAIAVGDVDGDSLLDLVTTDSLQARIEVLHGDGHGAFSPESSLFVLDARVMQQVLLTDLNTDGHLDIVAIDGIQNALTIFLGNGDGSFGPIKQSDGGSRPNSIAVGDLNLDGIPDLVIAHSFSFGKLYLGRGDGTFVQSTFVVGISSTFSVTMGDFNGDSALDFAVATRMNPQTTPEFVSVFVNTTNLALDRPTAVCSDGQATVSWTAPAGASVVTGYTVTPFIGYIQRPSTTFNSTATTQTLTGLTNGTEYRFKISARNAVGTGPMSQVSNPVTPAPAPSVPDSPKLPTATAGNGAATLSWNPPSNGCIPLIGYVVTPFDGPTALPPTTFNSTDRTQTITGLTNGVTYRFRIQAFNAIGTGPFSNPSNAVTPTGG